SLKGKVCETLTFRFLSDALSHRLIVGFLTILAGVCCGFYLPAQQIGAQRRGKALLAGLARRWRGRAGLTQWRTPGSLSLVAQCGTVRRRCRSPGRLRSA